MYKYLKRVKFLVLCKRALRSLVQLSLSSLYDFRNYTRYSSSVSEIDSRLKLEGRLCVFYHALEKGMSLKETRKGYGADKAVKLIEYLSLYECMPGCSIDLINYVRGVLKSYLNWNEAFLSEELRSLILAKLNAVDVKIEAGLKASEKCIIDRDRYENFVRSRSSIRNFSETKVPFDEVIAAVDIAKFTPSVCNRQPWRVRIYTDEAVENVLKFQHGNAGFGSDAQYVILVSSDYGFFWHSHERHQAYIDGGMFSMSLVYALHASGIGTCCLNLSLTPSQEDSLKNALGIPRSEAPIMMIAVGSYLDGTKVASSLRFPVDHFVVR